MAANFIQILDTTLKGQKKKKGVETLNIPLIVEIYEDYSYDFMIRKGQFTRFLYVKGDCRAYFSDEDIILMILDLRSKETIREIIENLKQYYRNEVHPFVLSFYEEDIEVDGLQEIVNSDTISNRQDIPIRFSDLYILLNMILAKDRASTELNRDGKDYVKRTLRIYIPLLSWYALKDEKTKEYFKRLGLEVHVKKRRLIKNYKDVLENNTEPELYEMFESTFI